MKLRILTLVAISLLAVVTHAQETVTIDLSVNNGAATQRASGMHYGIRGTTPANSFVTPLKLREVRNDYPLVAGLSQYDPSLYPRIVAQPAHPILILGDIWIGNGNPSFVDSSSMSSWLALVTSIVNGAIANGQTFEWDIWNEPDLNVTAGWTGTTAQFNTMWQNTVNTIRGIDSGQVIIGPSACCNISFMNNLLFFAHTNSVLPNIVAFHEFGGPAAAASDIANLKSFLAANDPGLTLIAIPEMINSSETYLPGTNVQYLAAVERAQIQGAGKACWFGDCFQGGVSGSNLSGLIGTDLTTIHAAWYAWQGYANVTGTIVGVAPSATVDGIAGQSASPCQSSSVFGRNGASSNVTFTFTHISSDPCLNVGNKIQTAVYSIANDNGSGSGGPVLISNALATVSGDSISVTIPSMGANDAAVIQLTPGSGGGSAKTYYVDYSTGSDTALGTSKLAPWKYAPGMNGGCGSGTQCGNTVLNAGDSVIFKGGVTWPNSAFTWYSKFSGAVGNPIYYGVDQTWFTGASWTRPIMNLGNTIPNNSSDYSILELNKSYTTFDNFEWTEMLGTPSPVNGYTTLFSWYSHSDGVDGVHVQNMYVHGWKNAYFSVGTGNLSIGSSTVNNYVPYSYSPLPQPSWGSCGTNCQVQLQSLPPTGGIPAGNSSPTVTGVSGSNPYTITFFNTTGGATINCTGCIIQMGTDVFHVNGGDPGPEVDEVFGPGNVVDGNDTAEVQYNPYGDCGLTESNNNFCVASGTAGWRVPNIWRDNVVQFVENDLVGGLQEWSGNLLQYNRFSTDPTAHTNFVESTQDFPVNNQVYIFGNVIRHGTNPNPSTPTGMWSVGSGAVWPDPVAGETLFAFNNVFYDVLQNKVFERGSTVGTEIIFNNSVDCGVGFTSPTYADPCADAQPADIFQNNFFATTMVAVPTCAGGHCITNLTNTAAIWNSMYSYNNAEQYAYFPPTSGSPTVGTGTTIFTSTFCNGITQTAAMTACNSDSPYAVGYNTTNHTVIIPARASTARLSTPDVGAYQFISGSPTPAVHLIPSGVSFPSQVVATTSTAQTITLTNSGTATLSITSITLGGTNPADFSETNGCSSTLAAGSSCNVFVTFTPASAASFSATVIFTTNASTSPDSVALTGTGMPSGVPVASISDFQFVNASIFNAGTTTSPISITINGTQPGQLLHLAVYAGWSGTVSATTISATQFTSIVDQYSTPFSYGTNAFTNYTNTFGYGNANINAYLISPGGNETVTITFNSTGGSGSTMEVYEVVLSQWAAGNGTIALDTDAAAFANNGAATFPIILPSITPAAAGELLIESIADQGAPTTGTPWVTIPVVGSGDVSYILSSASGATTAHWTGSGADSYAANITAFKPSIALGVFGNQAVGTPSTNQTVVLTNLGTTALTISSIGITGTNPGDFSQTHTCATTLAAGANCTISVGFLPVSSASFTATLTIVDNASGSPHTVALSGTGTAVVGGQVIMSNPVSAHFSGSSTYTFSIPAPVIGDTEVCELDGFANVTVSSIAHGGDSFTQATNARSTNSNGSTYTWTDVWYELSMGNAGTSVTLTLSGTSGGDYHCQEYSGGSIAFANAAGYTNSAGVTGSQLIGPAATLSGSNGFVVGVSAQATVNLTGTFANGGQTFSVSDISSGNGAVNLLNVAAGSYSPGYQYNSATDNTVSSSTSSFSATGGPIPPHLNKVIVN